MSIEQDYAQALNDGQNLYVCIVERECDGSNVVGIAAHGQMILLDPRVAVEVAQSLMWTAMDADPHLDLGQISQEYLMQRTAARKGRLN
ncbi:MAG: hypothetical protein E6Q24_14845 [Chitinophagaceae bacterium]|nr:MAG: hypothetical protein E6Q24_14845 [Chitinophagaceae bacterium]